MKKKASFGQTLIIHKGKKILTTVGNTVYEDMFSKVNTFTNGSIPAGYEHRPDLISNLFTDTPDNWWAFCERNAIFDIFEELNTGDSISFF